MGTEIHPTAIIEQGAELDSGVSVGAYAYIGAQVKIASGTKVMHHATIDGNTDLGRGKRNPSIRTSVEKPMI